MDNAIRDAAIAIDNRLAQGTKIAILNFASSAQVFSEYVMNELSHFLADSGKLTVVTRSELDLIRQEEQFQLSGEVSDEFAQAIGQKLGAQMVVSGSLSTIGKTYRFRIIVLNVASAAIEVSHVADINAKDEKFVFPHTHGQPVSISGTPSSRAIKRSNAYHKRGMKCFEYPAGYYKAIKHFTKAIKFNPNNTEAYNRRAVAYRNINDYDRSIWDYTQLIRLNPNNRDAYMNRGLMYQDYKKDDDRAYADITQAIRIDPNYGLAYSCRGDLYYKRRDYDRAIADYSEAIRLDTKNLRAIDQLGHAYLGKQDYDMAIVYFEELLSRNPNNEEVRNLLERTRRLRGW